MQLNQTYDIKHRTYGYGRKPFRWLYGAALIKITTWSNGQVVYLFKKINRDYSIYKEDILFIKTK
jgi:hypothetical protein